MQKFAVAYGPKSNRLDMTKITNTAIVEAGDAVEAIAPLAQEIEASGNMVYFARPATDQEIAQEGAA